MRRDTPRFVSTALTVRTVLTTASVAGVLTMGGLIAQAHEIETTPGVTVDTSVLDQMGQPQTVPDLLFPGLRAPRSRLLVPPVDGAHAPVLRRPTPDAVPRSRLRAPSTVTPPPSVPQQPTRQVAPPPAPPSPPAMPAPSVAEPMSAPQPPAPSVPAPQTPAAQPQAPEMPATAAPTTPPAAPSAALPAAPQAAVNSGNSVTLTFAAGETTLPNAARPQLEDIAKRLSGDEALQVRVMSYAGDTGNDASRARRTSLSRALAVRSFLMDQGVRSTRIEVRALGQPDDGPADRVDLTLLRP